MIPQKLIFDQINFNYFMIINKIKIKETSNSMFYKYYHMHNVLVYYIYTRNEINNQS